MAQTLVVAASSSANNGHADTFQVSRQGNQVDIVVDGEQTVTANLQNVAAIRLQGSGNQDTFIIDFSGGDPIPSGGIQVIGGGSPTGAADTLVLQSAPTTAPISSVIDQVNSVGAGTIQLQGSGPSSAADTITYSGIGRIQDAVPTRNVSLVDNVAGDSLQVGSPSGGSGLTIASSKTAQVELSSSPRSLTVDTSAHEAGAADAVQIETIQSPSPLDLSVHVATGDTIGIGGQSDLSGGNLTVAGSSIRIDGTLTSHGGNVTLDAGGQGTLLDHGTIDVSNPAPGQQGGQVELLGDRVELLDQARVDASGDGGGGTVLIGGDLHGANPDITDSQNVYVGANVQIAADAITAGSGGKVVVWADQSTQMYGAITARGGSLWGNGGFVEVSGEQDLLITGHPDLTARAGVAGTLLLDPGSVTINHSSSSGGAQNNTFGDSYIESQLALGSLTISTANSADNLTQTLVVNGTADALGAAVISWSSANTLTLIASGSISLHSGSSISNTGTGNGGQTLLSLNGGTITMSGSIGLSSGNVALTATSTIAESGGPMGGAIGCGLLTASSVGGMTLSGPNTVASFNAKNTGGGDVQLANTAATLTVIGVSQSSGGNVQVGNTGAIVVTGAIAAGVGKVTLAATSTIAESGGAIGGGTLATSSVGGTILNGTNAVASFNAKNTGSGGDVQLANTAATLTVIGVIQSSGGNIQVSNTGTVVVTGAVAAGMGNVSLTATSTIAESGGGAIGGSLLTIGSVGGTMLNGMNAVAGFNATNTTSGAISLSDTASPLTITGISQSGGGTSVSNTGPLTTTGAVSTAANGGISLTATGTETIGGAVTAGGAGTVTLDSTGGDLLVKAAVSSMSGAIDATAGGAITESGGGAFGTNGLLTTNSTRGQTLNGANTVGSFNATNAASGAISLSDTASPLTITGISETGGGVSVSNTGPLTTTGAVSTAANGNISLTATGTETIGGAVTAGGAGTVTLDSTGGDLLVNAAVSSMSGAIDATAGGAITESGSGAFGTSGLLTTSSTSGQALNGANTVGSFNATNAASGAISLSDTASPLTITGISQSSGGISVSNTGPLTTAGAVTTAANGNISLTATGTETIGGAVTAGGAGTVTLDSTGGDLLVKATVSSMSGAIHATAGGAITESGSGAFGTSGLLTTNSTSGQTLNGANTVGSFNATNATSGAISLSDTASPLTITGISQSGGGISVSNTGPLTTAGAVTTAANGNISLTATGTETICGVVTAGGAGTVTLDSTGGDLLVKAAVSSMSGAIDAAAGGAITESGSGAFGTSGLLTTNSTSGQILNGANSVGSFNATNATSGAISLSDTASPLTITGISETGGDIGVSNTGPLTTAGAVTTAANGNISLTATGTETIGGAVTAGGAGTVTLDSTGGDLLVKAAVSSMSGAIDATAGGAITESGGGAFGTSGLLTTNSTSGQTLNGANTVGSFNATNATSGAISLSDTASPLTITGISQSGGGISVSNTGPLTTTGAVTTAANGNISLTATGTETIDAAVTAGGAGTVTLDSTGGDLLVNAAVSSMSGAIDATAGGAITESGSGAFGTSGLLTTNSTSGQTLNGANTVGSFNATNATSGAISLSDTASPLTITGISETGGGVSVSNTGPLTTTGAVTTAANGNISLTATGTEMIGGAVTVGGAGTVTLDSTGGDLLVNAAVSSMSGAIDATAGGAITESGGGAFGTSGLLTTNSTSGQTLNGANTVGSFNATNATSGTVQLVNTGALSMTGISQAVGGNVIITNTGTVGVNGAATVASGNLTITATDAVSQTATITAGTLTVKTTKDGGAAITLTNASNAANRIDLQSRNAADTANDAGTISYRGATGFVVAAVQTTVNATLQNAAAVTETGAILASGLELLGSGDYTLTNSGNHVTALAGSTTGNISYQDSGSFAVGTVNTVGLTATGKNITLNSAGAIAFSGNVTLTAASANLTAAGAITHGAATTDIDTSAAANGAITLNAASLGAAGNSLELNPGTGALGLTASSGGIFVDLSAGNLSTSQITTLSAAGSGVTIALSTTSGNIKVDNVSGFNVNTQDDNFQLTAAGASKNITLGARLVAASANLTASGAIIFDVAATPSVQTTGSQTYNAAAQLQSDTVLVSTASGNVTFNATVDGSHALEVDTAANAIFNGVLGGATPLTSLTTDATNVGGQVQFNMTAAGGSQPAGVNAGALTVNEAAVFHVGGSTTSTPSVQTSGPQMYNGAVQLQLDTVLVSTGGGVTFNSTVDSGTNPTNLTINATGEIYFGNNVGLAVPLQSVTAWPNNGVTIALGCSINTVTGAVSSARPVLFVYQTSPTEQQIDPSQLTQTVYGYIGYIGAPSGYTELGQNYNIEILWADGSVTMSNTQDLPIAHPAAGYGAYVGYGTVATMTSSPGSPGVWTYNNTNAALPSFFPPAGTTNGITFALSHTYSPSFLNTYTQSELTAVIKLVNNSSIQLSDPAKDGDIADATPPAATSLNAVQTTTAVPITKGIVAPPPPPPFVPPPSIAPPSLVVVPVVASTPPPQAVSALNNLNPPRDTVGEERRMIEIFKLDPDGRPEKDPIADLTGAPETLNDLLRKLRRGSYRNGRYAVYLMEYADKRLIERRLLMEVYKSGNTLGNPVHEPGPGSRPLPEGKSDQKAPETPKPASLPPAVQPTTRIIPPADHDHGYMVPDMVPGPHKVSDSLSRSKAASPGSLPSSQPVPAAPRAAEDPDHAYMVPDVVPASHVAIRYPLIGAAVAALGGLGTQAVQVEWAGRVDQALADGQVRSLRRMARLARSLHPPQK